jgi:hypothetical protein
MGIHQKTQQKLNKANQLINKALKTNPIKTSLLNFAIGELQSIINTESPKAKVKEEECIINSENKDKTKVLGDNFEEHY